MDVGGMSWSRFDGGGSFLVVGRTDGFWVSPAG